MELTKKTAQELSASQLKHVTEILRKYTSEPIDKYEYQMALRSDAIITLIAYQVSHLYLEILYIWQASHEKDLICHLLDRLAASTDKMLICSYNIGSEFSELLKGARFLWESGSFIRDGELPQDLELLIEDEVNGNNIY